jgi:predicted DNA-binding transcriptional regulator AlpA
MTKTWIDTEEFAERIEMSVRTPEKWRVQGKGPAYFKIGGRVYYDLKDVDEWIQARRRTSTSDRGQAA